MAGKILALIGPSGVGKNYFKSAIRKKIQNTEDLVIFTTRPKRESDGSDRRAGLKKDDFINRVNIGEIIASHKPFPGLDYWYGFSRKQIDYLLNENRNILTEIHIDNVEFFQKKYSENIFMIGITADTEYLDKNIEIRGSETKVERLIRLKMAENENTEIQKLFVDNIIDKIFEANWKNRETLFKLVVAEAEAFFK